MASANTERLRVGYDGLEASGTWPPEPALLSDAFELHQDPILDNARVFRGAEAPAELLALTTESFAEPEVRAERFIEVPSGEIVVIVRMSGRGQASGIAINREQAHVWRFEGDQAREMTVHGNPREAMRALGLEEWPSDDARG
ncbi:MAG TPA: hypothetical protein VMB05_00520 [Solirubrobacteraceae bacterium]|nr:hypothetical protein [Solirubrobacteraceae bacterium]